MDELGIEIPIEDFFIGSLEGQYPIIREPVYAGDLIEVELDVDVLSGMGFVDRLVYGVGNVTEIPIEDFFIGSLEGQYPVIREPYSAGVMLEIPLGAIPPFPQDNMHLIDFIDDFGGDITFSGGANMLVAIGTRAAVILGSMGDARINFQGLSTTDFMRADLYGDFLK